VGATSEREVRNGSGQGPDIVANMEFVVSITHVAIMSVLSQIKDKDKVLKVPNRQFVRFIAAPAPIPSCLGCAKALPLL
jgi:hypothetical protein